MKYALILGGTLLLLIVAWLFIRADSNVPDVEEDNSTPIVEIDDVAEEVGQLSDVVSADADGHLVLGVGDTGRVGELELTFNEMVADYRCLEGIECAEAGAVVAGVTTRLPGDGRTFNMPSDEVPQEIGGYRISIVEVAPPLESEALLDPQAYVVTFLVEIDE